MIGMSIILIAGLTLLVFGLYFILSSAFKSQPSWGWGIIFLPVIYPLYSFLHWTESKVRNGFLVSVIGVLLVATSLYGGALNEIQKVSQRVPDAQLQHQLHELSAKIPQAGPSEKPLPNEAQANSIIFPEGEDYDPIYGDEHLAYSSTELLSPVEDKRVSDPNAHVPSYGYRQIEFRELNTYHGRPMKVTTKQGDTKEGRLIDSNDASLSLEVSYKNGIAAFEYEFENIADVMVYDTLGP